MSGQVCDGKDDTERLKRERNEKDKQSRKTNGALAGTIASILHPFGKFECPGDDYQHSLCRRPALSDKTPARIFIRQLW
jgi:hypothetical protein